MRRATRPRSSLLILALAAAVVCLGCLAEGDVDLERHLPITGQVTYHGQPVKRGIIHFLAVNPAQPGGSGAIVDGLIKDVFTQQPGDGLRAGRYKIAITAFDEDLLASAAQRNASGPDPVEVARAANNVKALIPLRYGNTGSSGLTAEFSVQDHTLDLELVD